MSRVIALLANPDSGSGEANEIEHLLRRRGCDVTRFALDETSELVSAERIVAAGGDGTIAPAAEAAARAEAPLAVVPVGTANDFARATGIPLEVERAVELAVTGARTRALDLGWAGERPFVNAASAGLSPIAARRASGLKGILGPLAYAVGALRAGLSARPIDCRVTVDGATLFAGRVWQITVGLTGAFGGGAEIDADPADGALDVVVIEAGSRARLVAHGYGVRAGTVEEQSGVVSGRGREIEVETDGSTGFNVDGELVEAGRLRFTVEPRAFELVVGR